MRNYLKDAQLSLSELGHQNSEEKHTCEVRDKAS